MSWQDRIQKILLDQNGKSLAVPYNASYKSIPFHAIDSTTTFGRRTKVHEFPFKDTPFSEDFGKRASTFTIIGYIVQTKDNNFDYFDQRDELIKVLNESGPGTLIHPFFGIQNVSLNGEVELIESFNEGGIARFTIPFINTLNELLAPEITIDPKQEMDSQASLGIAKLKEQMEEKYNTSDAPGWSTTEALNDALSYTQMLRNTISDIKGAVSSTIGTALNLISDVESTLSSVINLPGDLADQITQGFNSFLGLVGLFEEDFNQLTDFDPEEDITTPLIKSVTSLITAISEFGRQQDNTEVGQSTVLTPSAYDGKTETINITTSDRARQAANRIALVNYVRGNALLTACRIAVRGEYTSFNEANDVMLEIVDAMDNFLDKLGADANNIIYTTYGINSEDIDTYDTISVMRPRFIQAMQILGADLAKIVEFKVPIGVLSALELAYDRYEDIDRYQDIFDRNNELTNHPGFLPNLDIIEILSE